MTAILTAVVSPCFGKFQSLWVCLLQVAVGYVAL